MYLCIKQVGDKPTRLIPPDSVDAKRINKMTQNNTTATIRTGVDFYTLCNGWSTFFGTGKDITLGNGNNYAIINGIFYRVIFDGYNNQDIVPV